MSFPVWIGAGSWRLHPHLVFELLAYAVGARVYLSRRRRLGDHLDIAQRWTLVTAAVIGAVVGGRVLAWLEDPLAVLQRPELLGGQTIVGALLGGWLAVEVEKVRLGITEATGDLLVMPLAVGIAVGRIGCLLTGVSDGTYGVRTSLPWGVDAGDGMLRHPTPLYESIFMLVVACVVPAVERRTARGTPFRLFMAAYLAFRLVVDSIKPGVRLAGLTAIQWAAAATLVYLVVWFVRSRQRYPDAAEHTFG